MAIWVKKWKVKSHSNPKSEHTVSIGFKGEWGCSCRYWIFHHKDCSHIKEKKVELGPNWMGGEAIALMKVVAWRVESLREKGKTDEEITEILQKNIADKLGKSNEDVDMP